MQVRPWECLFWPKSSFIFQEVVGSYWERHCNLSGTRKVKGLRKRISARMPDSVTEPQPLNLPSTLLKPPSKLLEQASQVTLVVKNPPAKGGEARDTGSILGSERSPGEGNGNPLQYSCLDNPMDRGAWLAKVHRVAKSWASLKRLCTRATRASLFRDSWAEWFTRVLGNETVTVELWYLRF